MKKKFVVVLAVLGLFSFGFSGETIRINGSDTMVNLVQKLSEVYMKKNPRVCSLSVNGGGSGTGIAALINQKTDIANSSRPMKDKEIAQAGKKGVQPRQISIGVDALSVIVNERNPLTQLSMETIGKIFKGEITNWKEAGGADKPVSLYGRQPNSGTFDFFREHVLAAEYSSNMHQMNGSSQIVESVRHDEGAIGYVGVAYVGQGGKLYKGIKVLKVSMGSGEAYTPLVEANIVSGKYPIARELYQYIDSKPRAAVDAFIAWELSAEGQKVVAKEGFYPIVDRHPKSAK